MYDMGYHRVGCIGCPLAGYKGRLKEFNDYPTYKQHYIDAFDKMIHNKAPKGNLRANWKTGEDVFNWWIEKDRHETKGQITINDYLNEQTDEFGLIVRPKEKK